jgi:predicted DCC family thiol-disulfide oxidoreductase YuxK
MAFEMPQTNSWTGGQYSLYRALLGLFVYTRFGPAAFAGLQFPSTLLNVAGAVISVLLILGWQDRLAAGLLVLLIFLTNRLDPLLASPALLALVAALAFHTLTPPSPYGSWSARGRPDPGANWRIRTGLLAAVWVTLALLYAYQAWAEPTSAPVRWLRFGAALGFGLLGARPERRPVLWAVLLALQLAMPLLSREAALGGGLVVLHLLAFDPAWVVPELAASAEMLFYDGHCGLCHRTVRFVLAEDREGVRFRFSPLGSAAFNAMFSVQEQAGLPDSIVVAPGRGNVLVRSAAVLHIARRLGGVWRLLAATVAPIPLSARDAGYDFIAGIRKRLFAPPAEVCPVVSGELRSRFED